MRSWELEVASHDWLGVERLGSMALLVLSYLLLHVLAQEGRAGCFG